MTFWRKNGHLVGRNGVPTRCNHCPCDGCLDYQTLKAQAHANNWEWHEEGVISYLPSANNVYATWYSLDGLIPVAGCAFGNGYLYYIDCQCDNTHSPGYWIHSINLAGLPQGYWRWFAFSGACSCIDVRELLLTYPDYFGVLDISYGSNTKYKVTSGAIITYGMCGSTSFLDYRTLCVTCKHLASDGAIMNSLLWISPSGSPSSSSSIGPYDKIGFAGHAQPFQHDADLNIDWKGGLVQWAGGCIWQNSEPICGYNNEQQAQNDCIAHIAEYCGVGCDGRYPLFAPVVKTPTSLTQTLVPSSVYQGDNGWCCRREYYTIGIQYEENGTMYNIVYRMQWVDTNKGFLLNGENGYLDHFDVYGWRQWKDEHETPWWFFDNYTGYECPGYDTTYTANYVDEDMHWCHVDFQINEESN